MSGVTSLVDTLLATRLAQRVDLVPLKAELEIAGPGAVTNVESVSNDIRLPSRAALQQLLGVALLDRGDSSHTSQSASSGGTVTLSAVARVVSAILDLQSGATPKILGAEPLWPHLQPPVARLLTATLAHTVATSGLFYEAHLQQYAAGTRTLVQLAQEPQAHLDAVAKMSQELLGARATGQDLGPGAAGNAVTINTSQADAASASPPLPVGLAARLDPANLAATYGRANVRGKEQAPVHDIAGPEPIAKEPGANSLDAARSNTPASLGIHPDAIALVRQQLELLAQPVFRWGGEVWPGTPMEWEVHQEREESQAAADGEAVQRSWSTRLALTLPTLGAVEVRLNLAGATLQVHLAARENATVALLSDGCNELPKRLDILGLQLTGVQIGALAVEPAAQDLQKDDDAA